ncbi:hypothetical protein BN2475_270167 [Paraburkholderia ribeironis]|uniref:Uncharacterized protein n=1 Tax=Paraburkholderia ribeironis TaxID=1247936 RepID=A0A1N7S0S4_9BURK|nr:hypothetical protein BN2475_270167 [Paraburkholderia ribeironis]
MKTLASRLVLERSVYNRPIVSQENAGRPLSFLAPQGACRTPTGFGGAHNTNRIRVEHAAAARRRAPNPA